MSRSTETEINEIPKDFTADDIASQVGRVAVVTGGSYLGREFAAQFLKREISKVYLLAKSREEFDEAKKFLKECHGFQDEDLTKRTKLVHCNFSNTKSVKKAGDKLAKLERIDILFLDAGSRGPRDYDFGEVEDLIPTWGKSVVGYFVLVQIILIAIERTSIHHGDARIVIACPALDPRLDRIDLFKDNPVTEGKSDLFKDNPVTEGKKLELSSLEASRARFDTPWITGDSIVESGHEAREYNDKGRFYPRWAPIGPILFAQQLAHILDNQNSVNIFANVFSPGEPRTKNDASAAVYLAGNDDIKKDSLKGTYFGPDGKREDTIMKEVSRDLARNVWNWCDSRATKKLGKDWDERPLRG